MKYVQAGTTDLNVSQLCFGVMSFGGDADEATSKELYQHVRQAGINFFDAADIYNYGISEELLGRFSRHERQDIIIMTKGGLPVSKKSRGDAGSSRKYLMKAIDASLKRLKTDYVDFYMIHYFDVDQTIEEAVRALDDIVKAGKARYVGLSNFAAWQIEKALGISAVQDLTAASALQPMYSLIKRQAEVEILPMAQEENLAVFPYSPGGAGLLSGRYKSKDDPGRISTNPMYKARYAEDWIFETGQKFAQFARDNNFDPYSLAIAWASSHPAVTAPIVGARSVDQLKSSLASIEIKMTDDLRQKINQLSRRPPKATDRTDEYTGSVYHWMGVE